MSESYRKFTILIVDDSEDILVLLEAILGGEYDVKRAVDGRTALRAAFEKPQPDLILLDVEMPGSSGYDVCRAIKASPALADVPVIFLTAHVEAQDVVQGFQLGAIDYYSKPIDALVLKSRIRAHVELIARRSQQEELIRLRTAQLEQTRLQIIRRLARAMEYHETSAVGNRVVRLGHYARHLAQAAGAKPEFCELIMKAAPLHDIGKLGVPVQILRKSEVLTVPEREQMQRHALIGAEIIGEHDDPLLKLARILALTHHERWDGSGYPSGTRGNQIPWPGRIMAVVDAFEAMTATQFHHGPMPFDLAVAEIERGSGKQFDPLMVATFRKALPALRKVSETYADALGDMLDLDFASMPLPPQPSAAVATAATPGAAATRPAPGTRAGVDSGVRALASVQAQLKVERDLTAAAERDVATQVAAHEQAKAAAAREAEALELSKRRIEEEAAAERAAQERMQAEAEAANAARLAEIAKVQALAQADARFAAEQALAAAAADRKQAEASLAGTAAELSAAETRAAEAEHARAAEEAAARGALEARVQAEQTAAQLAQQTVQARAQALLEVQARARAEQALAAATQEKLRAEESARFKAEEAAAAEAEAIVAAKHRAELEAQLDEAARRRQVAEAGAAKITGERAELENARRAQTRSDPEPKAATPGRRTTRRTSVYAATLVLLSVAALAYYSELLPLPRPAGQAAPLPIKVPAPAPIPWLSAGAPIELRLDVGYDKLAPRERPN
ncbi:MAG: response regulator [Burkholderiales bacterium]|nr:response regulator [Burkholderiales bacterium]